MTLDLPLVWAVIIVFGVMMYVIMDGFDLGVGILLPFVGRRRDRNTMINSVAPVWDGNETWLVLGGAALFAAFPLAYGFLLSALYLPLMFMLAGLILRGVSFEFRFKAKNDRIAFWDRAFSIGSYVATFSQGIAIGAFINGFKLEGTTFTGSATDCFTPFSIFTGFGLVIAYALLGSTWLLMKTEGALNTRIRMLARFCSIALLVTIALISLWTPLAHSAIAARWFSFPNIALFAPVPVLVPILTWLEWRLLGNLRTRAMPFVTALLTTFVGYSGLAISMWPNIIPPSISIWAAASPPESMRFALVGVLLIIPVILGYTFWSYFVFRGKVAPEEGYQ